MPSTTPRIPRQATPSDHHDARRPRPLSALHLLVVAERKTPQGQPAPQDLVQILRQSAARVGLLACVSTITDLVGHRVVGRPDLVIGMLPGRGPSLAAVRVAERIGSPLLALVSHDGPSFWGEQSTLRRAARVVLTGEDLRDRVLRAGVDAGRIDVWHDFLPGAGEALQQLVQRTVQDASRPPHPVVRAT